MSIGGYIQVHFEGGTVAQIVYSGDQQDRGQQQVVYTADGSSYTSVESAEHTLVYIHPVDGTAQVRLWELWPYGKGYHAFTIFWDTGIDGQFLELPLLGIRMGRWSKVKEKK